MRLNMKAERPWLLATREGGNVINRVQRELIGRPSGLQAVIAGKPAPTGFWVHSAESGRLAGRLRWQASSYKGFVYICKISAASETQFRSVKAIVGASSLAMDSRAPRLTNKHALSLTTIASRLAPTFNLWHSQILRSLKIKCEGLVRASIRRRTKRGASGGTSVYPCGSTLSSARFTASSASMTICAMASAVLRWGPVR